MYGSIISRKLTEVRRIEGGKNIIVINGHEEQKREGSVQHEGVVYDNNAQVKSARRVKL